ncbi:MAG TPA: hypothetical protein VK075_07255 [Pseudogracilibacillus sp.]|nr:hypothetical protein [Pseudogracilibacillus sp.]
MGFFKTFLVGIVIGLIIISLASLRKYSIAETIIRIIRLGLILFLNFVVIAMLWLVISYITVPILFYLSTNESLISIQGDVTTSQIAMLFTLMLISLFIIVTYLLSLIPMKSIIYVISTMVIVIMGTTVLFYLVVPLRFDDVTMSISLPFILSLLVMIGFAILFTLLSMTSKGSQVRRIKQNHLRDLKKRKAAGEKRSLPQTIRDTKRLNRKIDRAKNRHHDESRAMREVVFIWIRKRKKMI